MRLSLSLPLRAHVVVLLGVQVLGMLLLLTPWAYEPSADRLLIQVVHLGALDCACVAAVLLAPSYPRAALVVLRIALVYAMLQACNAVAPI